MERELNWPVVVAMNILTLAVVVTACWWIYTRWGFWWALAFFLFGESILTTPVAALFVVLGFDVYRFRKRTAP